MANSRKDLRVSALNALRQTVEGNVSSPGLSVLGGASQVVNSLYWNWVIKNIK